MEKAKIQIDHLIQQNESQLKTFLDFFNSPKYKESTTDDGELAFTYTQKIYGELNGQLREVLTLIDGYKEYNGILNETRRKRDEVKNRLSVALKEIRMRKKYESFLMSCIRSGESFNEDFDWFCDKYEQERSIF